MYNSKILCQLSRTLPAQVRILSTAPISVASEWLPRLQGWSPAISEVPHCTLLRHGPCFSPILKPQRHFTRNARGRHSKPSGSSLSLNWWSPWPQGLPYISSNISCLAPQNTPMPHQPGRPPSCEWKCPPSQQCYTWIDNNTPPAALWLNANWRGHNEVTPQPLQATR